MAKKLSSWAEIEADPAFKMLPAPVQAQMKLEYLNQAGGPAAALPAPKPKADPLAPYVPKVKAPPPKPKPEMRAAPDRDSITPLPRKSSFQQGQAAGAADTPGAEILRQRAGNQGFAAHKPSPLDVTKTVPTFLQKITSGNLGGAGDDLAWASGYVAGQIEPANVVLGAAGGRMGLAGAEFVAKTATNPVVREAARRGASTTAAVVGNMLPENVTARLQGASEQEVAERTALAGAFGLALDGAGRGVAAGARQVAAAAPAVARAAKAALPKPAPPKSPTAIAAAAPDNVVPMARFAASPTTVARLVGEETGGATPEGALGLPLVEAAGRTFRELVEDESGEFDLSGFLSDTKRRIREATNQADDLRTEGRLDEADNLAQRATDLRDVRSLVDERPEAQTNPDDVNATRYFNPNKWNFASNDAILKFDDLTRQAVAERGMDPKQRIPQAEILRRAREITGERLDDISARKLKFGESLSAVEYEAAKNTLQQLIEDAVALERRINTMPQNTAPEVLDQMRAQLHQIEKDAKGFQDVIIPSRSQKGRDLNYLKMVAQQGFATDYWLARAHRVSGGGVPPHQMSGIREILVRGKEAEVAGDAAGMRQARIDLAKAMGRLEQTGFLEATSALRKAGLLTGIKTIGRNIGGTWAYQGLEEVVKMPAWMIDWAVANAPVVGTGNRTVARPSIGKVAAGLNEARTRGVREFGEVMIHGLPLDQLANLEITREINTGFAPFDLYVNGVFRFQSAQDRLAKAYAMKRSILDQAEVMAINNPGPGRDAMRAHLAANPTPEMIMEAIADADFMTFTNDTMLSKALTQGTQALNPRMKFALDLILPFKKTPLAVADRILQYAVLGQLGEALTPGNYARVAREGLSPAQQKAVVMGLSRGAVGSTLMAMGYWLAQNQMMTGTYEPDKAAINQAANRTPSSLKVNGQWIPINAISPIGNLLTLGATVHRMTEAGLGAADAPGTLLALGAKTVLDQPMTQGANQVVDLARDPDKSLPKFGASLAGSTVPTIFGEVAQSFDTVDREISKEWPESGREAIQKKMFGHRLDLPVKRTPLGDAVTAPGSDPANPIAGLNAFNPMAGRPALEDTDPVIRTLLDFNPRFPKVPTELRDRGDTLVLDRELKAEFQQRAGAIARVNIRALLRDEEFTQEADREVQQKLIEDALGDARQRAKEAMIDLYEDRLQPEADEE